MSSSCAIRVATGTSRDLQGHRTEHGFALHKGAFRDALCLRYGWRPPLLPSQCICGKSFTVEHALSCPFGGFPTIRHNEVRDITTHLLSDVCHNVGLDHLYNRSPERDCITIQPTQRMEHVSTSRRRDSGRTTDSVHFSMLGCSIPSHTPIVPSPSPTATNDMNKKRRGPMING